jgi:crotonobetainyl-CoA:carnitine CoA-transferase CaiB-like acyl-CoA transferase
VEESSVTPAFQELMDLRGRGLPADGEVVITGSDPVLSTRFRIGETCASVLAGVGVAVSDLWEARTGRRQRASIDVRHAAAALRSSHHLQHRGADGRFAVRPSPYMRDMHAITQPWPTRDGRWFLPHFSLPHLQQRVCAVLGCDPTPESVAKAVAKWDALDLEAAIDEARACGAMVRSHAEWLAHPHGQALAALPLVRITRIGDSDPEPLTTAGPPLAGVRVLDLTRILAGPVAARTLAEHGADVLMVAAQHLPQVDEHVLDTSHGKRSCFLDLREAGDAQRLRAVIREADVFSQGYRPGVMAGFGLGPEELAALRPGVVYLSVTCFGSEGPFRHRAGWEQVAQTVTGIAHEGGEDRPALMPAAACDYTTGYLGAFGTLLALARRAGEGGSYHVEVSLCQSGMLIYRQGKADFEGEDLDLAPGELEALRIPSETAHGTIRHLGPVLRLSETPPRWSRPTPVLGQDPPEWLPAAEARPTGARVP